MWEFLGSWLQFGAWYHFILGIGILVKEKGSKGFPFAMIAAFSGGIMILYAYRLFAGLEFETRILNQGYVPIIYLIPGSMQYTIEQFLSTEPVPLKKLYRLYPTFFVVLFLLTLNWFAPNTLSQTMNQSFAGAPMSLPEITSIIGCVYWMGIFLGMIYQYRNILYNNPNNDAKLGVKILGMILKGNITFAGFILLSTIFRWHSGIYFTAGLATLMAVIAFIGTEINHDLFNDILPGLRQSYRTSRILNLDLEKLQKELDYLLKVECVYREEDLSLASLSEKLNVKDYQLSEYINAFLGMNFNRLINEYRIAEVCRLLEKEPKSNLLSLAYQVGFNSKANFNLAFKSLKKKSPSEYAKSMGKVRLT
ncbi:AraC family transcriptional regulator [Leptospira montravelensis]|uniref:AraC family transcriptional regulator n=1 Tax=Leptospira montravelensis TaxID=2484961 RepID=A0ABY2LL74_9LEPT|nr:AraC family transcriptional regulator [Leptospira montravelensis]TGK86188.1 AraC family transcriptional regulator [Leptospira montravelensis]TGK95066.1 AraC family transcriptional regulator [Leptospira montravelensis]